MNESKVVFHTPCWASSYFTVPVRGLKIVTCSGLIFFHCTCEVA